MCAHCWLVHNWRSSKSLQHLKMSAQRRDKLSWLKAQHFKNTICPWLQTQWNCEECFDAFSFARNWNFEKRSHTRTWFCLFLSRHQTWQHLWGCLKDCFLSLQKNQHFFRQWLVKIKKWLWQFLWVVAKWMSQARFNLHLQMIVTSFL